MAAKPGGFILVSKKTSISQNLLVSKYLSLIIKTTPQEWGCFIGGP